MDDKSYYDMIQVMVDKAKELKLKIDSNVDDEARGYLRLALEKVYLDMRELIKDHDKRGRLSSGKETCFETSSERCCVKFYFICTIYIFYINLTLN